MSGPTFDMGTPEGGRTAERLRTEHVIWLTTVRPDEQPQSTPVWFLWREDDPSTVLIYSIPISPKLSNIRANPMVALHLNDIEGSSVISFEARAEIVDGHPPATGVHGYVEKYREAMAEIGYEPEPFARLYSSAIRCRITRARINWV